MITVTKETPIRRTMERYTLRKNWKIWKKLAGIWKDKEIVDPLKWQKKIRAERI